METGRLLINGEWVEGRGAVFEGVNPSDGKVNWVGKAATAEDVNAAVQAGRSAFNAWVDLGVEGRIPYLEKFRGLLQEHKAVFARCISEDMGKPVWEAMTELGAMIGKIDHSVNAYRERCAPFAMEMNPGRAVLGFRAHGVVGVFGPFNFPGHVPNGHIVPALLAGNTVVYKPSQLTPMFAERMISLWEEAGLPKGVINLVQGSSETGIALSNHEGLNGVFFTGSAKVGCLLQHALADRPGTILALELGGNNPLIVDAVEDHDAAAYTTTLSAYITSGQRCTCSSRLIVPRGSHNDAFLERLVEMIGKIQVGVPGGEDEPFMGPVVTKGSAEKLLAGQAALVKQGGHVIVEMEREGSGEAYLTPGLIDVTEIAEREDEELFGPILQVIRVEDFDAAVKEANNTRYGLAAGLLSDDRERFEVFMRRIRAGVVNWNRQTTGASSRLPFGGVGMSGNHRPSGYYAADYCSWPISSLQVEQLEMPENVMQGIAL